MKPQRNDPCPCGSGRKFKKCCGAGADAQGRQPVGGTHQAFQQAARHYQTGNLGQAEAVCRRILGAEPGFAPALDLLGVIAFQTGHPDAAEDLIRRAVQANSAEPAFHNNLGLVLWAAGKFGEAADCCRRAIALSPEFAGAHFNLGNALRDQGNLEEAAATFRRVLALRPDYAEGYLNLGDVLQRQGRGEEAVAAFRRAVALKPDFPAAHYNLGNALKRQEKLEEAVASYRQALALKPDYAEAHNNLGAALEKQNRLDEAVASYRQALALKPDYAEAHNNLGGALTGQGLPREGIACYRRALSSNPRYAEAHSNLLLTLNYAPYQDPASILAEHVRFDEQHAKPLSGSVTPHLNDHNPRRRLRIGYVSPDFRKHSVAYFVEPILAHHDREAFEICCYHSNVRADEVTGRLRGHADHWIDCGRMSDEALAAKIRQDRIDILVDLAGHTAGNRLLVFARKPAPVQITYLGYAATTGLAVMDYRLTDGYAEPPGLTERHNTEMLIRLPQSLWCYRPPADMPDVGPLPALVNGCLTFGSFNSIAKIGPGVIALWARLLLAIPDSRLVMVTVPEGEARQRTLRAFAEQGVAPERLEIHGWLPGREFRELHQRVDMALDPFPYNGGTTTCETLWMGVPVITLVGDRFSSRLGYSLLSTIGRPEFAATTEEDYLRIAVRLAQDPDHLAGLRAGLRERMASSPLMAEARFTRDLEGAYRTVFESWCAQEAGRKTPPARRDAALP